MYKNIYIEERYTDQPTVHIWDSQKGHIEFQYNKKMYVRSSDGDYTSLYGDPLAEVPASNIDYNTKQRLQDRYGEGEAIFQSDLQLETQILSEVYRDAEEPSEDVETLFFDIEVSMEGELPKVSTANNPITSIAYTVRSTGESKVLIWDPENETKSFEEDGVEVIPFEGEDQLLYSFVEEWRDIDPDIVSGWNSDGFDIPYLYRRVSKVINNDFADRLSPIEEVEFRKNRGERGEGRFFIAGVSALDYYSLYKNFTFTELESYSLDNVSKEELDRGKVEYMGKEVETEDGETVVIEDLDDLKEYDPKTFVEYNCLPVDSSVWTEDRIIKIGDLNNDRKLFNSKVENVFPSEKKKEYKIDTVTGRQYHASKDHRFPVIVGRPKRRKEEQNYKVSEIKKCDDDVYLLSPKVTNSNDDFTYRDLLLSFWDEMVDYNHFDFFVGDVVLSETKIKTEKALYSEVSDRVSDQSINRMFQENDVVKFKFSNWSFSQDISKVISDKHLHVLGLVYTDGCAVWRKSGADRCDSKFARYCFYNTEFELADYVSEYSGTKVQRYEVGDYEMDNGTGKIYEGQAKDRLTVVISQRSYLGILYPFIYSKNNKKKPNTNLLSRLSFDQICSFISGVIDGDGFLSFNEEKSNARILFSDYSGYHNSLQELIRWNGGIANYQNGKLHLISFKGNDAILKNLDLKHPKKSRTLDKILKFRSGNTFEYTRSRPKIRDMGDSYAFKIESVSTTGNEVEMVDIKTDTNYFVTGGVRTHNCEDVRLVKELDDKFDFIELARKICHLGHVPYEDIYMSSRYIDGAFITRLNKRGIIAPNVHRIEDFELDGFHSVGSKEIKLKNEIHPDIPRKGTIGIRVSSATKKKIDYERIEGDKFILEEPVDFEVFEDYSVGLEFEGAYVKEPDPGLYEWIYDLDLTSMYPSIIMSLNISPETLVGKIYDWSAEGFIKGEKETYKVWIFDEEEFSEFTNSELEKFLEEGEFSVAANGAFYRNDKKGIIPEVLEEWFTLRQEYKSTRNEWREKEGEKAEEKAEYYDKLQHVHKILINCFTPGHEIVTKDGVKNVEDVEKGDLVYSVDPETGIVEYKPVSRTYRQENYDGNVVNFQNSFVDFSVTPNHDMVYGDDEIYKEKAGNCLNDSNERRMWSHGALRKDSPVHVSLKNFCDRLGIDYEYDVQKDVIKSSGGQSAWIKNTYLLPNFLKLCGQYVFGAQSKTDESNNESYSIATENNKKIEVENTILHKTLKEDFGEDAQSKRIPGWIWKLDGVILKNLLETIFSDEENRDSYQYKTGLEEFAQDVVRLAYHCGHRAVVESPSNETISHYEVSIYDDDKDIPPLLKDEDRELEEYDGSIVCVEVEDNHTVLAGKNGKFNWTGQSVYGIMGLPTFRFFNLYSAEATTLTGQALIKYTQRMGDHYYNKKIGKDVELEDGSEMNIDLNETYLVMRDGVKMEVKGKKLQEGDELVIED